MHQESSRAPKKYSYVENYSPQGKQVIRVRLAMEVIFEKNVEDSLRGIAKLPADGSDLAECTVEELIARIVKIRGIVRESLLQYDKQVEMMLHSTQEKQEKKEKKEKHSVLLPEALSKFCTIKASGEMKPLYDDVAKAQSDFEDTKGANDTELREAVSALMAQLPKYIQARARAPRSHPEFAGVVATGNKFFVGVYTQVRGQSHMQRYWKLSVHATK